MWTNMFDAFVISCTKPKITANFTHKVENGATIPEHFAYKIEAHKTELESASSVLRMALTFADSDDKFIRRDLFDICRTMLGRFMNFVLMKIVVLSYEDDADTSALRERFDSMLTLMGEPLSLHEDYSLYASLKKLAEEAPVTEGFETTLKRNCAARYCRNYVAEMTRFLYPKEAKAVLDWACTPKSSRPAADFSEIRAKLNDEFMSVPLCEMQTPANHTLKEILSLAADVMNKTEL